MMNKCRMHEQNTYSMHEYDDAYDDYMVADRFMTDDLK